MDLFSKKTEKISRRLSCIDVYIATNKEEDPWGHLRFVSSSPIEQGRVTHRPLGIRSLLTSVLPERRLPLVVSLQLQEAGRGVVAAVESSGGRDLPLRPGGGAPVPAATPITSSAYPQSDYLIEGWGPKSTFYFQVYSLRNQNYGLIKPFRTFKGSSFKNVYWDSG